MRISTSMMNNNSITGMLRKQTELANTSNQMGSGKRILTPSDDPVASAMAFNSKNKLANIEQYGKNIDYARKSLQTTESTLSSISDRLQRVRQLAIAANSDTLGEDGRKTIGLEIKEITGQLAKLMNTRDESGNYIFSGSKVNTSAFTEQSDGSYRYDGDSTAREIQVSDTSFVSPFISGLEVFQDIANTKQIRSYANDNNATPDEITVSGSADFLPENRVGEYQLEWDGASWAITTPYGQTLTDQDSDADIDLDDLESYVNGGASGSGTVNLTPPAGLQPGDKFTLVFDNPKEGLLTGMQRFERALSGFSEEQYQKDAINDVIAKSDAWLASIADARSEIGTRWNGMESIKNNNEDLKLFLKENVSSLEDLDYAEASGRFILQQTALTASQKVFSQMSQLSLFNYIR